MAKLKEWFGKADKESKGDNGADEVDSRTPLEKSILQEEQQDHFKEDLSILEDEDGSWEQRLQREAHKEVQTHAEDSLKRMHVIQMGRCPVCGEHLGEHLFASICESCGWHTFDVPRTGPVGPVRVHLKDRKETVEGTRCYVLKTGFVLVVKDDVVIAKIPSDAYVWIEYVWSEDEIDQRHKRVLERMQLPCGWCNKEADPDKDGFHLIHVAFGSNQERYCFCSDECYEAFRKMYPARVHRNCYDRNCAECNLCVKRYGDEAEGIRMLAKDFLTVKKKKI